MWASFVSIFQKEFLHVRRDRATLVMALALPLFQLLLFGFIDQTVRNLPTIVVDQDRSPDSREFQDQMRATGTFKIETVTTNPKAAREEIISGRARVGVILPPDFHDKKTRGQTAKVLVLIDGSDSTASAQALASINGLVAQSNLLAVQERVQGASVPMAAQPTILFNPDGRTPNYIIPGLVAILLQIVAIMLAAVSIVRERERGTLDQLLVTPIHPLGLMLGKLGPYLIIGLAEMAMVLTAMRFGFGVPIRGSLVFLFAMAIVYLFSLLALGLFLSTVAKTQIAAQQMTQMLLLPSIFLSGYIFPAEGLPVVLRYMGRLLPATHMIAIMRGVVLRDAGPFELWPHVLVLVIQSVLLVYLSARRFKKVAA
ncbi:MAG: ABC transporter permease [Polyangiaceae bacterium]